MKVCIQHIIEGGNESLKISCLILITLNVPQFTDFWKCSSGSRIPVFCVSGSSYHISMWSNITIWHSSPSPDFISRCLWKVPKNRKPFEWAVAVVFLKIVCIKECFLEVIFCNLNSDIIYAKFFQPFQVGGWLTNKKYI